jgi:hypothetical protein
MIKDVIEELREWAMACRADYGEHSWCAAEYTELADRLEEGVATLERELTEERAEHRRQVDEWTSRCEALERELGEARAGEEKLSKMCELWEALVTTLAPPAPAEQPPEWRYQRQPFMPRQPPPPRTTEAQSGEQEEAASWRRVAERLESDLAQARAERDAEREAVLCWDETVRAPLESDLAQARASLREARDIATSNANDCAHLRQSAISLSDDLAQAHAQIEQLETEQVSYQAKVASLESDLAQARARIEELDAKLETRRQYTAEQVQRAHAAEAKAAELEEHHIQVADELTAAEAKLAEIRRENSTMRVRLDALEQNQRDDEAKLARVEALVEQLASDVEYARAASGPQKGMTVPWHGRFASCVMVPSALKDLESLVRDLRAALAPEGGS